MPTSATPLEESTLSNILQQNDRSNHRKDDDYHCHDQPGAPVFPVSRVLSCLEFLIPSGSLCAPSCLLLLSGFLRLCHVLPFSLCSVVPCIIGGAANQPDMLGQRMSWLAVRILPRGGLFGIDVHVEHNINPHPEQTPLQGAPHTLV
jgi:hypothetical protein